MAGLKDILSDPNYVNANAETKRAIFDKFSAQDQNYVVANEETKKAIQQRFGVAVTEQPQAPQEQSPQMSVADDLKAMMQPSPEYTQNVADPLKRSIGLTGRAGLNAFGGGGVADMIGLPTPETSAERIGVGGARTIAEMAGLGAIATKAVPLLKGGYQGVAKMLADRPDLALESAAGAGIAGSTAKEMGTSDNAQLLADFVGGLGPAAGKAFLKYVANKGGNIIREILASQGSKDAIESLSKDSARNFAGDTISQQRAVLRGAEETVPGVTPTVAEAIAKEQIGAPSQFGGATVRLEKDLGKTVPDVLPSWVKTREAIVRDYKRNLEDKLGPERTKILFKANNINPLESQPLVAQIDVKIDAPGTSTLEKLVLKKIKKKIIADAEKGEGVVDARDLYTTRKEIGNNIKIFSKKTGNWDKATAAKAERDIQLAIDESIDAASGGAGWRTKYMEPYAAGMEKVRVHEQSIETAKELASKTRSTMEILKGETPKFPTLLNRHMMFANFVLRMAGTGAEEAVAKNMIERMKNPKAYAEWLKRTPSEIFNLSNPQAMTDYIRRSATASVVQQAEP